MNKKTSKKWNTNWNSILKNLSFLIESNKANLESKGGHKEQSFFHINGKLEGDRDNEGEDNVSKNGWLRS